MDKTSGNENNTCIEWSLLLRKIHNMPLDSTEESMLESWLNSTPEHAAYYQRALKNWDKPEPQPSNDLSQLEREIFKNSGIFPNIYNKERKSYNRRRIMWLGIAASFILIMGLSIWFSTIGPHNSTYDGFNSTDLAETSEINPGGYHATLILASGESINLENSSTKKQITDSKGNIISVVDGLLSYLNDSKGETTSEEKLNTLIVPRGGEYSLRFSDGSTIWINSRSTLKFPENFSSDSRKIFLDGEAFFEIRNDQKKNFVVETSFSEVEVYGTSFNVRSYSNENAQQTTLVNGNVEVKVDGKTVRLRPGQQARVTKGERNINVIEVDTTEYCSWRNGLFIFEYRRLDDILSQLSDWYDVDFTYAEPSLKELHFTGDLEKYADFNDILTLIGMTTDISFDVDGKHVTVKKDRH